MFEHGYKIMNWNRHLRSIVHPIALAIILASSACQTNQLQVTDLLVTPQKVEAPLGDYSAIVWLSNDLFVVDYEPEALARHWTNQLWIMKSDGSDLSMLSLPVEEQQQCSVTFFGSPVVLADGRLAFERECHKLGLEAVDRRILTWDPETEKAELLYEYEVPAGNAAFTLAPDLSRGLLSSQTGIEDKLFWLDPQSSIEFDVGLVRANTPTWSPNGEEIAFFGNQSLRGSPGPDWASQPYNLWLIPSNCDTQALDCTKSRELLLTDIYFPSNVQFSPNGKWLVFDGDLQGRGKGIWLFQIDTKTVTQILMGDYIRPTWSPNGQFLVVIGPKEEPYSDSPPYRPTLYIVDVHGIVESSVTSNP